MNEYVISAVNSFIKNDIVLLDLAAHEQAISHRIAVYLESIYAPEGLNIDCEYNKNLVQSKTLDIHDLDLELCRECGCGSCVNLVKKNASDIPEKHFRPDIIVHSRNNREPNLIVIEVKKEKECPFDEAKLKALTKPLKNGGAYGYELGVFIWFPENKPQYKWFVVGEQV